MDAVVYLFNFIGISSKVYCWIGLCAKIERRPVRGSVWMDVKDEIFELFLVDLNDLVTLIDCITNICITNDNIKTFSALRLIPTICDQSCVKEKRGLATLSSKVELG